MRVVSNIPLANSTSLGKIKVQAVMTETVYNSDTEEELIPRIEDYIMNKSIFMVKEDEDLLSKVLVKQDVWSQASSSAILS